MKKGGGGGGWLGGNLLASIVLAVVAVNLFNYLFSSASSGVAAVARPSVFVGVWTTVTTKLGMRAFNERIQRWRGRIRDRNT